MKKVGLLTMHRVYNVGSALQAYALQHVVESLGYECELIDYRYPTTEHLAYQQRIIQEQQLSLFELVLSVLRRIKSIFNKDSVNPFEVFYKKHFHCTEHSYSTRLQLLTECPEYDIYMSGSDQVWNPQYIGFDTSFLLDFAPEGARRISYASSFTINKLPNGFNNVYKKELMKFAHISVRERSGIKIVKELTGKDSVNVCDPTLLLSADQWSVLADQSMFKTDQHFILVYFMAYAYNPYPEVFDYIDRVYKQLNLPIVFFNKPCEHKGRYKEISVHIKGPNEFLYLFSHADYVITDSFHGTAFSLIFQKPFITCIQSKESQDSRVTDLLDEIGAIDYAVVYNKKDELPSQTIDLNVVKKIEKYRKHSLDWLIKNIESKE